MEKLIQEKVGKWLNSTIDKASKEQIVELQKSTEALADAFYKDLAFGTGGLRGIMGIGSNRINIYTIGMATQGLANYLCKVYPHDVIKVAIAYDSRNDSRLFADTTANVLTANDIQVYFYQTLRATPQLSFTVKHFGCQSGIVITASHNPKEYNGYKVYWDDGGQVVAPHDKNIIEEVNKINSIDDIKQVSDRQLITYLDETIDEVYADSVVQLSLAPKVIKKQQDLSIVYSPLHGAGITQVPLVLGKMGFENVHIVEEQKTPDGNFPTVIYPNPEEKEALRLSLDKAINLDADLVLATDPDADRVGIALKNHHLEWQLLNGNQTACLLVYYLLYQWKENNQLNGSQFICKTIVTTEMIEKIALYFHVNCYSTLTGFKFIAEKIRLLEGKEKFIVGGEESYGYLIGDSVRDKDAIASCALIAETVAYAKENAKKENKNSAAFNLLIDLYLQFGCYRESLVSIVKKGKRGQEEILSIMNKYRNSPPTSIIGIPVVEILDYSNLNHYISSTKEIKKLSFPKMDVLQFKLVDDTKISVRPSGTEPKIKFYFSVNANLKDRNSFDVIWNKLGDKLTQLQNDFTK